MTLVTVPQTNPNDEVTALSVNQGSNAIAAVVNGNIDDANISTVSGSKITAGTLPASALNTASNVETRQSETIGDIVASGLIWSSLTGLNGTMSAGVAYVTGKRLIVSAVASFAFTASRDTYVYVDNTAAIQYSAQTTGAVQPNTPANNQLIAKVVTGVSAITSIADIRVLSSALAWKSYTLSWTAVTTAPSIGNGSLIGNYSQIGKVVNWRIRFVAGSTTTFGTGAWRFSLPVAANPVMSNAPSNIGVSPGSSIGTWYAENPNVAGYGGMVTLLDTNKIVLQFSTTTAGGVTQVGNTAPATWANTWYFLASGTYEAA